MVYLNRQQLDARRLLCPMPVIRTQDKAKQMQPGDQLEVICTDPGALYDIPAWCRINGHKVMSTAQDQGEVWIVIELGPVS